MIQKKGEKLHHYSVWDDNHDSPLYICRARDREDAAAQYRAKFNAHAHVRVRDSVGTITTHVSPS